MLQFIALNRLSFQIFGLLPITKVSSIPHEVVDSVECLHVRPRRYVLPYPRHDERDDAHTVFQVIFRRDKISLVARDELFSDICMLLDYLECRAEDGNKFDPPSACMPQV